MSTDNVIDIQEAAYRRALARHAEALAAYQEANRKVKELLAELAKPRTL